MSIIDKKLDEVFSELDFAYQYKISDYAISEEQEIEFEKQGLKEVANAKQKIKQLIMDITTEAKIYELKRLKQLDAFNEVYSTDTRCGKLVDIRIEELKK